MCNLVEITGNETVNLKRVYYHSGSIKASYTVCVKIKNFSRTSKRLCYSFQGEVYEKLLIYMLKSYFLNDGLTQYVN